MAELPQCADGIDSDDDGDADYPEDPSCTSYLDDTEGNTPECDDAIDNDDDGHTDADDPDCENGNSETGVFACADGSGWELVEVPFASFNGTVIDTSDLLQLNFTFPAGSSFDAAVDNLRFYK